MPPRDVQAWLWALAALAAGLALLLVLRGIGG